jgi:RNA polymerase II subunit A small phosphatase-like protein
LEEFLAQCLEWFRVGVWTSSSSGYAEAVVPLLFTKPDVLEFVWSRARCVRRIDPTHQNYFWIKDLHKLKRQYPLEKILMVDDTPKKLVRNYGNHVLVREWTGDTTDDELQALLLYLEELGAVDNVRKVEKRGWRRRVR